LDHLAAQADDIAGMASRFEMPVDHFRVVMVQLAREGLVMPVGGGQWRPTPDMAEAARHVDLDRDLRQLRERLSMPPHPRE